MLKRNGKGKYPYIVPNLRGKAFRFSLLNTMIAMAYNIYGFYYVEVFTIYT